MNGGRGENEERGGSQMYKFLVGGLCILNLSNSVEGSSFCNTSFLKAKIILCCWEVGSSHNFINLDSNIVYQNTHFTSERYYSPSNGIHVHSTYIASHRYHRHALRGVVFHSPLTKAKEDSVVRTQSRTHFSGGLFKRKHARTCTHLLYTWRQCGGNFYITTITTNNMTDLCKERKTGGAIRETEKSH